MQPDDLSSARTVDDLLAEGRSILRAPEADADTATVTDFEIDPREAAYLLAHVLGLGQVQVRAFGERPVDEAEAARYLDLVRRRAAGEPAAYLTGRREFYGREFQVDPRVLVPRPETEHLIDAVLGLDLPASPSILDVGTGSGCIAVSLALELGSPVIATDLSVNALAVARGNRRRLGADVRLVHADLASPLRLDAFDVVASNPPYVSRDAMSGMSREVTEHEPHLALFAPERGTHVLERLLRAAGTMRTGSWMVLEIGHDQGVWIERRAEELKHLELVELIRDYGGRTRTAVLRILR